MAQNFRLRVLTHNRRGEEPGLPRWAELGCQVLFSGGTGSEGDGGLASWTEFLQRNNEAGDRITSLCHTRPSGSFFGLAQQAYLRTPAWIELMKLPSIADKVAAMRDPATRQRLISEAREAGGFGQAGGPYTPSCWTGVPEG